MPQEKERNPEKQGKDFWLAARKILANQRKAPPLEKAPENIPLPLSFAQERLWQLIKLDPETLVYNIPNAFRLSLKLDISALEKSLSEIIRRHSILRTIFKEINGETVQVIVPATTLKLPIIDLEKLPSEEQKIKTQAIVREAINKPFNLTEEPGFRGKLIRFNETESILLLTTHHIIFDGFSFGVFSKEMTSLYEGFTTDKNSALKELPIQYSDFAYWQKKWLEGEAGKPLINYWKKQLSGNIQPLKLPTDKTTATPKYEGATFQFSIPNNITQELKKLSQETGVTLFTTLLAAYNTLLYAETGQEDIILCSPVAGRDRPETQQLIGYFNHLLVMRNNLTENPTFLELLQRVNKVVLGAREHQDLPFQKLIDFTNIPLTKGMFALQNYKSQPLQLKEVKISSLPLPKNTANFDLSLTIYDRGEQLLGKFQYKTNLFDTAKIKELGKNFPYLLEKLGKNPNIHLADLETEWEQNVHPEIAQLPIPISQIEKILAQHPNIEENTILLLTDSQGNKKLTAYIVPTQEEVPTLTAVQSFLAAKLPKYMVPESFVLLDSLPLKTNGKINYRELIEITQVRQKPPTTPPSTPVEQKLAEIWKRVLWLEQEIGIHDNFFDLGGHSLLAVKLVQEIEQEFNKKLPLSALFQLGTIAEMANLLIREEEEITPTPDLAPEIYHKILAYTSGWRGKRIKPHSLIVGMNEKGTKQPLFWCLQGFKELSQLAKYMGEDQPIYGMRSGHLAMEKTEENIKALAAYYVTEILEVDPVGPYLIGGNCQAGKIAFTIAKKLQEAGKTVTLLCILDKSYFPQYYTGKVAFFFGRESLLNPYKYCNIPEIGWRKYYPGGFSLDVVSGQHGQFFNEPNIQVLTEKIKHYIKKAQTEPVLTQPEQLDILPEAAYKARLIVEKALVSLPETNVPLAVKVQNLSPVTWQATEKSGITLVNYWSDSTGKTIQRTDGIAYLPSDVPPEGEINLEIQITTPIDPGNYFLILDLVEQGVTRFKEKGSQITIVPVKVIPSQTENNPQQKSQFYCSLADKQFEKGDAPGAIVSYQKAIALNPQQPFKVYQNLGDALSQLEKYATAISAYQTAIDIDQTHSEVYYMLGKAQQEEGELEKAKISYEKAIELEQKKYWYYQALGNISQKLEQHQTAIKAYQTAIELTQDYPEIYCQLGNVQVKENQLEKAIENYEQAIKLQPDNPGVYEKLGTAKRQQGDIEAAVKYYQKAIEIQPEAIGVYINWGRTFSQQNEEEKALEIYQKALEIDPNHAGVYRAIGDALLKKKDFTGARENYEKVIELDPDNFNDYRRLGDIFNQQGELEKAKDCYNKAIEMNPENPGNYHVLGNLLFKQNQVKEAQESYEKAIKLGIKNAGAYSSLAEVYFKRQNLTAAEENCQKAIEIDPKHFVSHRILGDIFNKQGKLEQAITAYQQAIKLQPDRPAIYQSLGYVQFRKGELKEAINSYQTAIKLEPKNPGGYRGLANVYFKKGDYPAAISNYEQAIKINPQQPFEIYKKLGDALKEIGEQERAIKAYEEAKKLEQNNQ